ncbi:GumC family protein [Reichenbachiella versicolor]|uniref:GumC family protein n=1 Tax=Reichenbachiella versicolor TaxID=1821036 RepID=UPI000D6E9EEE|nr:hypothetical protein [Reichenbachiella versicolor]
MNGLEFVRLCLRNVKYILLTMFGLFTMAFLGTRNEKKEYVSHTLMNTGLISGYNIESQSGSRVDYAYTNNEIDNLINLATSTETMLELSVSLVVELYDPYQAKELALEETTMIELDEAFLELDVQEYKSKEELFSRLFKEFKEAKSGNFYDLFHSKNPYFGFEQLSTIDIHREGNTDMIAMEYKASDARICQMTLELLTQIFLKKHAAIKKGQTENVIGFFEEATKKTLAKLNDAENELLKFRVDNQIINYYEQTRFIAGSRQELDKAYQAELKTLAGSDSVILHLEERLDGHSELPVLQASIAEDKSRISTLASELTLLKLTSDDTDPNHDQKVADIEKEMASIRGKMNTSLSDVMKLSVTPDGIHTKELLNEWLDNNVIRAQSLAQIQVIRQRQKEYEKIYSTFSPLGSTLKRLEREIDVAEREYLENLHSFNQARLHKFNMMMSSDLKVIDAPFYPANPEKSKRMVSLILAFVGGAVLSISILVAFELMNNSVKNSHRAEQIINLEVAGTYSVIPKKQKKGGINYKALSDQALNQFFQKVRAKSIIKENPFYVAVTSTERNEGKSFLLNKFYEYGQAMDNKILFVVPDDESEDYREDFIKYSIKNEDVLHYKSIRDLMADSSVDLEEYDYVIVEIASLIHTPYHPNLIIRFDMNVLVCNATRTWTESDRNALKTYATATTTAPQVLLNGVSTDVMEEIVGQVPKKRTFIRKLIKRLFIKIGEKTFK